MRHEKERNQHVTKCCIEPHTGTNFGRELRKHKPNGEVDWTRSRRVAVELCVHFSLKIRKIESTWET